MICINLHINIVLYKYGRRVGTPAYSFSYLPTDLRPGIGPTNKIFQKVPPKNIIRASQKAQQDMSTSAAYHWSGEQRNITGRLFVLLRAIFAIKVFCFVNF